MAKNGRWRQVVIRRKYKKTKKLKRVKITCQISLPHTNEAATKAHFDTILRNQFIFKETTFFWTALCQNNKCMYLSYLSD